VSAYFTAAGVVVAAAVGMGEAGGMLVLVAMAAAVVLRTGIKNCLLPKGMPSPRFCVFTPNIMLLYTYKFVFFCHCRLFWHSLSCVLSSAFFSCVPRRFFLVHVYFFWDLWLICGFFASNTICVVVFLPESFSPFPPSLAGHMGAYFNIALLVCLLSGKIAGR